MALDPLLVDVQDGAASNYPATSEAPDGSSPRMALGLYQNPDPDRDSALDAEVILHEYTHVMSNRRVGGGNGGSGITAVQSRGLGEGWSDFLALALLSQAGDALDGNYAYGAYTGYLEGGCTQNYYYGGSRYYPYSTVLTNNPISFKDIDLHQVGSYPDVPRNPTLGLPEPDSHFLGEVWGVTLWEARANLINKMGFANGNETMLRLVADGMNLAPPNPTFLQARDAILLADRVDNQGANQAELWTAFAKRGMGYSAVSPASSSTLGVVAAFDAPPQPNPWLWAFQTAGTINGAPAVGADGTVYFGSTDAKVYAVSPNGAEKWEFLTGGAINGACAIGSVGTVYVGAANGNLYALNPDGTQKWSINLGAAINSCPAIGSDDSVVVGTLGQGLYCLNANGTVRWQKTLGGAVYSSPSISSDGVLANEIVYAGCMNSQVYAYSVSGGVSATGWPVATTGAVSASPAIADDGSVYVATLGNNVAGFNSNGSPKASWPYTTLGPVYASPVVGTNNTVFVGADDGTFYAITNTNSGVLGWNRGLGSSIRATAACGWDNSIFLGTTGGVLYALSPDGTTRWSVNLGSPVGAPVIGENGVLYCGAGSAVYAIPSGTVLANGQWPAFARNLRHTGNAATLLLRSGYTVSGLFSFLLTGKHGLSALIQASTDLANWTTVGSGYSVGFAFTDSGSGGYPARFYRASSGSARSLNTLGYVKKTNLTGFTLIANQLYHPGPNTVGVLIPNPPAGTAVWKWNEATQSWITNRYSYGSWTYPNMTLLPGEGCWFENPSSSSIIVTSVGEVPQSWLVNLIPPVMAQRSSIVAQAGLLQSQLGFPAGEGDMVYRYFPPQQSWVIYTYAFGSWSPTEPSPTLGEAFWVITGSGQAKNWTRSFSIWP